MAGSTQDNVITLSKNLPGLKAGDRNNLLACLDEESRFAKDFIGIIKFLKRSRILTAITTECTAYYSHQREFWQKAVVRKEDNKPVIISSVQGTIIKVSAQIIRDLLGFGDSDDYPYNLEKAKVRGCFLRCGFSGDIEEGVLNKGKFSDQYKYLCHVLMHCLSPRKGGFDDMNERMQSMFTALVLNAPFNFSGLILRYLQDNLSSKDQYLMYARFLQIIINNQAPGLPKQKEDEIELKHMNELTFNRMQQRKKGTEVVSPRALIGHLAHEDYICPEGKLWRHADSTSQVEVEFVIEDEDEVNQPPRTEPVNAENLGLLDEEDEDTENTDPSQYILRKRKQIEAEGSEAGKKKKAKRARVKRVQKVTNVPSSEIQQEPQTHQPSEQVSLPTANLPVAQQSVAVSGPSQAVVSMETVNALSSMLIKVMADQEAMKRQITNQSNIISSQNVRIEELAADNKRKDTEIERLKGIVDHQSSELKMLTSKIDNQSTLFITDKATFDNRLKTLEARNYGKGPAGLLKIKAKSPAEEEEDFGDSDENSESDDSATPEARSPEG